MTSGFQSNGGADFTKTQALHLIVHFLGVIHQPLLVGTGYYKLPAANGAGTVQVNHNSPILVTDPNQIQTSMPNDIGGNSLSFTKAPSQELHAYWDNTLVQKYAGSKDAHHLAQKIGHDVSDINAYINKDAQGNVVDYHAWAAAWAVDSLKEAGHVYDGLQYDSVVYALDQQTNKTKMQKILITLPVNYATQQASRAAAQLAKAGSHLALLLNSIQWDGKTAAPNSRSETPVRRTRGRPATPRTKP